MREDGRVWWGLSEVDLEGDGLWRVLGGWLEGVVVDVLEGMEFLVEALLDNSTLKLDCYCSGQVRFGEEIGL